MRKFCRWTLSLLWLSGCFYPAERGKTLETRLDKLTQDNQDLQAQLKDEHEKLLATLPKVDEKIAEVTRALNGLDQASRRTGADIGVQLQKNVEDVAQLRGQVDAYLHNIQELDQKIAALQSSTDERLSGMQGPQAKHDAEARREADKITRPTDKKEFYALAESKAKAGDSALARQLFREFVRKWSKDDLTGEAYFAIGETFYADKSCDEALPEYGKVVQGYPKSRSAPMALVRSGDCFKTLGKTTESRYAYEEVLRSYPKSDAAKLAKTKLASLAKAPKAGSGKATRKSTP